MKKITFCFIVIFIILLGTSGFASDELLFSEDSFRSLAPGYYVSLNRILNNGDIVCCAESDRGKPVRVILADPYTGRVKKQVEIPAKTFDYVASDDLGKYSILYSRYDGAFYLVNFTEGKSGTIFKQEKGKPAFALFGALRSGLSFTGEKALAWGYFTNEKGVFDGEFMVEINPDAQGISAFNRLFKYNKLRQLAELYYPQSKRISAIEFCPDYFVFCAMKNKDGAIIAYKFMDGEHYRIDKFLNLTGLSLSQNGNLLAYITEKDKQGTLYLYNLKNKDKIKLTEGKLLNPVFSPDETRLGVGRYEFIKGKGVQFELLIINLADKSYPVSTISVDSDRLFQDWKFVKNNKELVLFTGRELYHTQLK